MEAKTSAYTQHCTVYITKTLMVTFRRKLSLFSCCVEFIKETPVILFQTKAMCTYLNTLKCKLTLIYNPCSPSWYWVKWTNCTTINPPYIGLNVNLPASGCWTHNQSCNSVAQSIFICWNDRDHWFPNSLPSDPQNKNVRGPWPQLLV